MIFDTLFSIFLESIRILKNLSLDQIVFKYLVYDKITQVFYYVARQ